MSRHPPEPLVVHALPHAPAFVGRARELADLGSAWAGGAGGVVALVGLGGAGKTSVAAQFLDALLAREPGHPDRPVGIFVWSFYQEPDAARFLDEAHTYFASASAGATSLPARGAALLHLLREALARGGPHLLVLDGLERVQQQGEPGSTDLGRVEDPLLRGLLSRIAEGAGRTTALVTSRFPLTDLEPYRGRGYRPIEVEGLDQDSAIALLRRRGVVGDDPALAELVRAYGAHALTLDHLGGLIGQFLGGDPRRAPEAPTLTSPADDRQALRLVRLLRAYEAHLPPAELALLCRLCLLRNSVSEEQLLRLFVAAPVVHTGAAREAAKRFGQIAGAAGFPEEEVPDFTMAVYRAIEDALLASPIAGPAENFADELAKVVGQALTQHFETPSQEDVEAFLQLYCGAPLDTPTEKLPLPATDRQRVRELGRIYRGLREHPLAPKSWQPHGPLVDALDKLGWGASTRAGPDDLSHADVCDQLQRVERRLRRLACKHFVLRCVRAVCRVRQQKWVMAGPLAALDALALRQVVASLTDRHLLLREANGAVGIHPAVRDHFARLGDEAGRGGWHDLIREQLVSLVRRPGRGLPEDTPALDLVEEAIHHTLAAGRVEEAWQLYERGLGGLRHLGWKLGEMTRGLRILRGFRECPDGSSLGWFLRALGELDQAYEANRLPYFRADIRLLQGRLPEVAAEGDPVRTAIAWFLRGQATDRTPPDLMGLTVPRIQLVLVAGRLGRAGELPRLDGLYKQIGWEGDRARIQLLLAEVARRQAEQKECRRLLDAASQWVLRSGSVEHLCLWHLVRALAARDTGALSDARRAVDEGIHMARHCGLGLYHILLLNARAEIVLPADPGSAEHSAHEAQRLASAVACEFAWGAAAAGHHLGQSLAAQSRFREARAALEATLELRLAMGDPGAEPTRGLLERLE
jgi:hypothetical protein